MSQLLLYDGFEFNRVVCLEDILNTPDSLDMGYLLEVDLKYPHNIRQSTKHFPFAPENKIIHKDDFIEHVKKIKPKFYIPYKK